MLPRYESVSLVMASAAPSAAVRRPPPFTGRNGPLDRYFYLAMSLAAAAAVAAGFGQTVRSRLFHPAIAPPPILWVHAAVFSAWLLFVILQSALIRTRNLRWHRLLGWAGALLAAISLPLGLATAVSMVRFPLFQIHRPGLYPFLAVPCYDVVAFTVAISLAILWRGRPEFHRRLIFFATGALLLPAFARIDRAFLGGHGLQDFELVLFLALGAVRDLLVNRRVHAVYRFALPLYAAGQLFVFYLVSATPAWWLRIAHAILA